MISLIIPRYEELTVAKIWDMVKDSDDIMIYFPDFKPGELPERDYLISVISTINQEATKTIVAEAREKRSISQAEDEGNLVKVTAEFKEAFRTCSLHKNNSWVFR